MHVYTPNENREVVLYDHFAGDNSSFSQLNSEKNLAFLVNFIIQELKFCKIAHSFCISFSREKKFERFERISLSQNPNIRQEEQRKHIQDALNHQSYKEFRAYAEQQFPDKPDQQAILIRQLQEQHYYLYMQQVRFSINM